MPANNWPSCLRAPASTVSLHKFSYFNRLSWFWETKPGRFRRTKITSGETNETIGDITRKNSAPIPVSNNLNTNAEQESEHAEAVLPPLHRPARRRRDPRHPLGPERPAPRPA